MGIKIKHN